MTFVDYDNVVKWRRGVPTWRLRFKLIATAIGGVFACCLLW